jgi:hypothetical protein
MAGMRGCGLTMFAGLMQVAVIPVCDGQRQNLPWWHHNRRVTFIALFHLKRSLREITA